MDEYGVETIEYHEPFYSDPADVPSRPKLFAGRAFRVETNAASGLPEFEHEVLGPEKSWLKTRRTHPVRALHGWEFTDPPPSRREVISFCEREDKAAAAAATAASQLAVPTQKNAYGFKLSQKRPQREQKHMSVLILEVFAPSRQHLLPDPEKDEVVAAFFCLQHDRADLPDTTVHEGYHAGYVLVEGAQAVERRARIDGVPAHYVEGELDLINWVIDAVKLWDPDVLAGWELHNASWGYLAARAHQAFGELSSPRSKANVVRYIACTGPVAPHYTGIYAP
jgi:DNA polymerase zeta